MGLPKGELPRCIDKERGSAYGQMLWEEVQEVRDAVEGGILHGVLAESIDVLYLVFNLLQECGLERAIEPAFLLKHGDNMKKQHETVTHLACTRKEYVQTTGKSEEELAFTVSRTEGGKWLLYSKGKLIKPHDYVSSDFEIPVENLLMLVPYQTQLPYTGMAALDQLPPVARDKDHQVSSVELAATSL